MFEDNLGAPIEGVADLHVEPQQDRGTGHCAAEPAPEPDANDTVIEPAPAEAEAEAEAEAGVDPDADYAALLGASRSQDSGRACSRDSHCPRSEKCCRNRCGRVGDGVRCVPSRGGGSPE